jgi:hypothetical protein
MTGAIVPGFLPSSGGLHFDNRFPHVPIRTIALPGLPPIGLGDAANGLCGGMTYTARDLFEASAPVPPDPAPPAEGSPRFDRLVDRQFDSFDNLRVPLRFYDLMSPTRPDTESFFARLAGRFGLDRNSRTWVAIAIEWPSIKADIDAGRLTNVGLVRVVSADPGMLGHNHQVMAYGYDIDGSAVALRIYDPNFANDDTIRLTFDSADASGLASFGYPNRDGDVLGFFRLPFQARDPGPWR